MSQQVKGWALLPLKKKNVGFASFLTVSLRKWNVHRFLYLHVTDFWFIVLTIMEREFVVRGETRSKGKLSLKNLFDFFSLRIFNSYIPFLNGRWYQNIRHARGIFWKYLSRLPHFTFGRKNRESFFEILHRLRFLFTQVPLRISCIYFSIKMNIKFWKNLNIYSEYLLVSIKWHLWIHLWSHSCVILHFVFKFLSIFFMHG